MKYKYVHNSDKKTIEVTIGNHQITYDLENNFGKFSEDAYKLQISLLNPKSSINIRTDDNLDLIVPNKIKEELAVDMFLAATEHVLETTDLEEIINDRTGE